MKPDSTKPPERFSRLRIPSVGVVFLIAAMLMVGSLLLLWRTSRSGIRRVEADGGEAGGNWTMVSDLVANWIDPEVAHDATNHARFVTDRDVRFVYYTGPQVDDDAMTVLSQFPMLKGIQLDGTSVTDAAMLEIATRSHLEMVALQDSRGVSDTGILALSKLPHLWHIDFENTQITGDNLSELTRVEIADLDHCDRLGPTALQELCRLPKLRNLSLYHSQVNDQSFHRIDGRSTLEELDLSRTAISDVGLLILVDEFPNLTTLYVDEIGGITDEGALQLAKLKSLILLSIYNSNISNQTALSLQAALPHCKVYHETLEE